MERVLNVISEKVNLVSFWLDFLFSVSINTKNVYVEISLRMGSRAFISSTKKKISSPCNTMTFPRDFFLPNSDTGHIASFVDLQKGFDDIEIVPVQGGSRKRLCLLLNQGIKIYILFQVQIILIVILIV